jgi:hypothetical protein
MASWHARSTAGASGKFALSAVTIRPRWRGPGDVMIRVNMHIHGAADALLASPAGNVGLVLFVLDAVNHTGHLTRVRILRRRCRERGGRRENQASESARPEVKGIYGKGKTEEVGENVE